MYWIRTSKLLRHWLSCLYRWLRTSKLTTDHWYNGYVSSRHLLTSCWRVFRTVGCRFTLSTSSHTDNIASYHFRNTYRCDGTSYPYPNLDSDSVNFSQIQNPKDWRIQIPSIFHRRKIWMTEILIGIREIQSIYHKCKIRTIEIHTLIWWIQSTKWIPSIYLQVYTKSEGLKSVLLGI